MSNAEHLGILDQGAKYWNEWRINNPEITPNLQNANLYGMELSQEYPEEPALQEMTIELHFIGADFRNTDLRGANLSRTQNRNVSFRHANLTEANLTEAYIMDTDFGGAILNNADLSNARFGWNSLSNVDLSMTKGLDSITHSGPSAIGIDTLYRSAGNISDIFLRGCGVPDEFITFIPSLIGAQQAVQFYSCFISYSHKDEEFVKRLHSRLRSEHIRVWFAPEDMKGGKKVHEQIDHAIQIHDRLLLVLSENSLQSEWVKSEIRKARKVETREKRQKLFPIRLVDFDTIRNWECFDADSGKDLSAEIREYFIPDYSNWKSHDAFEAAFKRLLNDLRTAENKVVD